MVFLGETGFTHLLVGGAAAAAGLSAAWLLLVLVAATLEAATSGRLALLRFTGCPLVWRRRLLRLLVPALAPVLGLGGGALPATASPGGPAGPSHGPAGVGWPAAALAGLPLPDRQPAADTERGTDRTVAPVVVEAGDTLWQIAARLLPAGADAGAVAGLCSLLYSTNRRLIGDDPDLIRPGQRLRVPASAFQPATATPVEEEDR